MQNNTISNGQNIAEQALPLRSVQRDGKASESVHRDPALLRDLEHDLGCRGGLRGLESGILGL